MREEWRDISGYEGYYQVSNMGRVKSLRRTEEVRRADGSVQIRTRRERILKARVSPNGYHNVALNKLGKVSQVNIHRLVISAFVGKSDLQVNHINEDKSDNRLENLEYMTPSENTRYSQAVPVESFDLNTGKVVKSYAAMNDVKKDGHDQWAVSSVCHHKYGYKSHHGLGWRFSVANNTGANRRGGRASG